MTKRASNKYDIAVIGGGFYGCAVALELSQLGKKVVLLEKEADIMQRASYVNQARIHQGYHYPRSVLTALRSRINFDRFIKEYDSCVYSEFDKYYAIGKMSSKINAEQFRLFCQRIGAPIQKASKKITSMFNPNMVDGVFKVQEYAFDARILKHLMSDWLEQANVELYLETRADNIQDTAHGLQINCHKNGINHKLDTEYLFNCTYSAINQLMNSSNLPLVPLKHEFTEMALVKMPDEIQNFGITIMDGPFFSVMPFPARRLHTFSHVRYTPHHYWQDDNNKPYIDSHNHFNQSIPGSHFIHMVKDAQRYMPLLQDCEYVESLWEIKTVLPQSEVDDSRPILFRQNDKLKNVYSIMGGKIDNIFDIREKLNILFNTE